jgi:hypothetical protein
MALQELQIWEEDGEEAEEEEAVEVEVAEEWSGRR